MSLRSRCHSAKMNFRRLNKNESSKVILGPSYCQVSITAMKLSLDMCCLKIFHCHFLQSILDRDHPFKTSANFSRFLTPPPLPSAVFYYYPSAQIWQIFDPSPPKQCRRLKWMVPRKRLGSLKCRYLSIYATVLQFQE